jgi:hypothetical protein
MDTPNFVLNADPLCVNAAIDQDKIGWQNFVEGKIAKRGGSIGALPDTILQADG